MEGHRINAHTHLYSGLAPLGLPPLDPPPRHFLDILERRWWRLDRALEPETLRAASRFYIANALLAGTTAIVDHHESPNFIEGSLDVLADACEELGVRALLCYGVTERNRGRAEAEAGLAECQRFIETNRRTLVRGAVGIHASFTVSDESLREAGDLARRLGAVVHVHVAEDAADVEDAKRRGYEGPLERLLALDVLPPGSILAHGVCLSEEQVARAADAGLWLVQNPRSNEANGVGFASSLGTSDRAALGTDGFPSDLSAESAALLRIATERREAFAGLLPRQRAEASLRLARDRFGDCPDDRVDIEDDRVLHVVIADRDIVRDGALLTADLESIERDAERAAAQLFSRMNSMGEKQ
jgi:cytosine/adenosine deaminase-related metal-dependent hydrolase